MVKGISKQVIVVHAPDKRLCEQAIFILKEDALRGGGVTEDALFKEAKRLVNEQKGSGKSFQNLERILFAIAGALVTGIIWAVSGMF